MGFATVQQSAKKNRRSFASATRWFVFFVPYLDITVQQHRPIRLMKDNVSGAYLIDESLLQDVWSWHREKSEVRFVPIESDEKFSWFLKQTTSGYWIVKIIKFKSFFRPQDEVSMWEALPGLTSWGGFSDRVQSLLCNEAAHIPATQVTPEKVNWYMSSIYEAAWKSHVCSR